MAEPSMREAAVGYARGGWPVVVLHGIAGGGCACRAGADCPAPGKHPRWRDWQKHATSNADLLAGVLDGLRGPYNLGLRLVGTGVAVVDVDTDAGARALARLVGGALDGTPAARTRRGMHYFVATDRRPGVLLDGVELKAENVVVPPSLNPDGTARAWLPGRALGMVEPPPLPAALADRGRRWERAERPAAVTLPAGVDGLPAALAEVDRLAGRLARRAAGTRHPALVSIARDAFAHAAAGRVRVDVVRTRMEAAARRAYAADLAGEPPDGPTHSEIAAALDYAAEQEGAA